MRLTHKDIGPHLDRLAREPEFQPGSRHVDPVVTSSPAYEAAPWG